MLKALPSDRSLDAGATGGLRLAAALLFLLFALAVFPQAPSDLHSAPDAAWMVGLNMAHPLRLLFGRDVVFTYGPLGYLNFPVFPEAGPVAVAAYTLAMYTGLLGAAWLLLYRFADRSVAILALFACGAGAIFLDYSPWNRNVFRLEAIGLLLTMCVLSTNRPWTMRRLPLALLAVVTGVASMVKLSTAVELAAVTIFLCACILAEPGAENPASRAPQLLGIAALIPLTAGLVFLVTQGSLTYLGSYLKAGLELISGYPGAMFWDGTGAGGKRAILIAVASAFVLLIGAPLALRGKGVSIRGVLVAAIVIFFAFKNFAVRQDTAHAPPYFFEAALGAAIMISSAQPVRRSLLLPSLCCVFTLLGAAVAYRVFHPGPREILSSVTAVPHRIAQYVNFEATASALADQTARAFASDRLPQPIIAAIGSGAVDVFPHDTLAARSSGVAWLPRPMFESYSAYTPFLDQMDAQHIQSAGSEWAVLMWVAPDDRIPFLDSPLVWRELLDRYDFNSQSGTTTLLRRRSQPRFSQETPLATITSAWGEDIPVPAAQAGEFIGASIEIDESFIGKLNGLVFRPAGASATLTFSSGAVTKGRIIQRNLPSGLLLSPFTSDSAGLPKLFQCPADPAADRVQSIRFESAAPWQVRPTIRISWFRLHCA